MKKDQKSIIWLEEELQKGLEQAKLRVEALKKIVNAVKIQDTRSAEPPKGQ